MLITTNTNTFIKREGDGTQANDLQDSDKFEFLVTDKPLEVNWAKKVGNHYQFELRDARKGFYNWYIFAAHAVITEDNTPSFLLPIPKSLGKEPSGVINWSDNQSKVSKHFKVYEVIQLDPRRIPTNPTHQQNIIKLAKELDKVRDAWDDALIITSWYRPNKPIDINKAVGGVPDSQHITGLAADIKCLEMKDLLKFQAWLDERWFGALGYGARRGFVHLDSRNGKGFQTGGSKGPRWNY